MIGAASIRRVLAAIIASVLPNPSSTKNERADNGNLHLIVGQIQDFAWRLAHRLGLAVPHREEWSYRGSCRGLLEAIEDVSAQGMARWQARMIEIPGGIAGHAQSHHDALRGLVCRHRESDDLAKTNSAETVLDRRLRRLGGISFAPISGREAPCRLDCRRKRHGKANMREADHADERRLARKLDNELPKSVLAPMRAQAGESSPGQAAAGSASPRDRPTSPRTQPHRRRAIRATAAAPCAVRPPFISSPDRRRPSARGTSPAISRTPAFRPAARS